MWEDGRQVQVREYRLRQAIAAILASFQQGQLSRANSAALLREAGCFEAEIRDILC